MPSRLAPPTLVPPASLALDHVVLCVHDAAAGLRFYQGALGLPLVAAHAGPDWGGHRWLMMIFALGVDGQHLAITAFDGLDSPPVNQYPRDGRHVAFAAASQAAWDAFRTRVEASAAEWWDEDHGDQRSVYVADPSGNVLEVTTPPSLPWTASHESPAKVVERFLKKATPPQPRSRGRRHSTAS